MKGQDFYNQLSMERDKAKLDEKKYQIPDELSMIHATTYADTNPIHSRKKSFHDTKRTDIRSHKTSLSSLFTCSSRQADKHNISKQKANNEEAKQSYGSLKSREVFCREPQNGKSSCDSSSNLHRATLWHSQTGRKSRLQSIQDSLRQSFRFRKDHNSNLERHLWCKSSNEENSFRLHSKKPVEVAANKTKKSNSAKCAEIPTQSKYCDINTNRGKTCCRKTPFVKGALVDGSVVDNRKCKQDKMRKNNKLKTKRTRTRIFSVETCGQQSRSEQSTLPDLCCQNKKKRESRRASFSRLWKPKSLNVIGNFFKRPQSLKREENNHVQAVFSLKLSTSLSTANCTDLGFLLKRDPDLGSISSLEDSEKELYPWDFSDCTPGTRNKYRSLKRSRAALIFPQSVNRSFSLDDVSVHSEQLFKSGFSRLEHFENSRSMEVLGESHRSSSPFIYVDFYNDDGSISPTSRSNQNICNEDAIDKVRPHGGAFDQDESPKTKIVTATYLLDREAATKTGHSNQICNQHLHEQANLSRVSRSQEFCKCHLSQTDQEVQTVFADEITTSKCLTNDQRELNADPRKSSENAKKLNKIQGAKHCFDSESDPKLFDMRNNQESYNLIHLNSGHDFPAEKASASSENSKKVLNENTCSVLRQMEQTKVTHQRAFDYDAEFENNVQCYGDKNLLQNKTTENESVKKYSMRETKTEIDCKSPIKSSLSNSIKPRPERKNAVSSFHMSNDIDFMRNTNILTSTEGGDNTFHAANVANGFVKSNARDSFDRMETCQRGEIKRDSLVNRYGFSTQENMALHLDLKSFHKFNGVTDQNSVSENIEVSRTSSGSLGRPEIRVSCISSFEFQSLNQNNHLQLPSVDSKPETLGRDTVVTSSSAPEHCDLQTVQERICPVCHKIKPSSTNPVEIKRPLPRYLSPTFSHSDIHLSKSLPSLHAHCISNDNTSQSPQGTGSEKGSPVDSPIASPLSSSPESDCEKQRARSAHAPGSVSPVLRDLVSREYRSSSCTKLDEAGKSLPTSPPPQVTPRVKSIGQLAPISTTGRKTKLSRRRGWLSVPCVEEQTLFGKRHSISVACYGAAHDIQLLNQPELAPTVELPNHDPKAADCLTTSLSNLSLSSAATESEASSTTSVNSEVCTDTHRNVPFGRSVSVPGHIHGSLNSSTLSVPDGGNMQQKQWILSKWFSFDQSLPLTDESDEDIDDGEVSCFVCSLLFQ